MSSIVLSAANGRPSLADVLPNCLDAIAGRESDLGLGAVRSAVVLFVDGLGASMLRSRAGHARHLVRGWARRDTAFAFPSTTVSGVTTLTTGRRAGEHGMIAYTVYDRAHDVVRNQLKGWDADMHPERWQLERTVFERMAVEAAGVRPVVVGLPEYAESGLTAASLRGAAYVPARTIADRLEAALDLAIEAPRSLVYCYVAELDQAGHAHGWESDQWLARLEELDAAYASFVERLPADVGVLVTADHGMVDIPFESQVDVDSDGDLMRDVVGFAGEPRLRHLFTAYDDASAAADLATAWREREGRRSLVVTRDEAIDAGWYGPVVTDAARARIGNVIVAAQKLVGYYLTEWTGKGRLVKGQHGSTSPEETIVPLIRAGAFARA